MQSWQLGSIGWGCTEPVVWKTLGTTCGRCQAGLEIPVGLPMWSLVGQQDWKKNQKTNSRKERWKQAAKKQNFRLRRIRTSFFFFFPLPYFLFSFLPFSGGAQINSDPKGVPKLPCNKITIHFIITITFTFFQTDFFFFFSSSSSSSSYFAPLSRNFFSSFLLSHFLNSRLKCCQWLIKLDILQVPIWSPRRNIVLLWGLSDGGQYV